MNTCRMPVFIWGAICRSRFQCVWKYDWQRVRGRAAILYYKKGRGGLGSRMVAIWFFGCWGGGGGVGRLGSERCDFHADVVVESSVGEITRVLYCESKSVTRTGLSHVLREHVNWRPVSGGPTA